MDWSREKIKERKREYWVSFQLIDMAMKIEQIKKICNDNVTVWQFFLFTSLHSMIAVLFIFFDRRCILSYGVA